MSLPPTWAPTAGETFGEWKAKLVATGFLIWDRVDDSIDEYQSSTVSATAAGDTIDPELDFVNVRSDLVTSIALLPKIAEAGIGKRLRLFVSEEGCRLRTQGDGSVYINGTICSTTNELAVVGLSSLEAIAVDARNWRVTAWNGSGSTITLLPVARGATTSLLDENGNQSLTAGGNPGPLIDEGANHVSITSAGQSAAVRLPQPVVGKTLTGWIGANGFSLGATYLAGTTTAVTINDVTASTTNKAEVPATSYFEITCVSATEWNLRVFDSVGAVVTALIPVDESSSSSVSSSSLSSSSSSSSHSSSSQSP